MQMAFVSRTFPDYANPKTYRTFDGRRSGWRFLIPLIPWRRHDFDPQTDGFVGGAWWWTLGASFEPIVAGEQTVGVSIRLNGGWVKRPLA